jgi:outer membrane protein assembly factor BamB
MKLRKVRIVLLAVSLLAITSMAWAGSWPNHRYDPAHTANNARETFDPATLAFRWSKFVGNVYGSGWSLPVATSGGFIVGVRTPSGQKLVRMLKRSDGTTLWSKNIATTYLPTGPVIGGAIFIAGDDPVGRIHAFDMLGNRLWTSDPTGTQWSVDTPVVSGKLIYIIAAGVGTDLFAFSVVDGKKVWSQPIEGTDGTPAVSEGKIFTTAPGQYYAFSARTGAPLWHRDFGVSGGGGRTPTAGADLVYMVDYDYPTFPPVPTVYALNKDTGATVWKRRYAYTTYLSDLALASTALFLVDGKKLYALNPLTGTILWSYTADEALFYPPVIAGDHVFVASQNKTYAIHIPSKTEVWTADQGGRIVVLEKWVLITESNGWISAYKAP